MFSNFDLTDESIYKIIDLLNMGIYWKDTSGNYLGCNKYMLDIFHVTNRMDIIGKNDFAVFPKEEANKNIKIDRSVIQGKQYNGDGAYKLISGEIRNFVINKVPLYDAEEQISGMLAVLMDITDFKNKMDMQNQQAISNEEQKIRQIIDVIDASIYWKDVDGYMRGCNRYVLNMFGVKKREEIIGKNEYDLVTHDEALKIREIDTYVLEHGSYHGEEIFTLPGGRQIIMQSAKSQLFDNKGNIIGIVGTSLDITAQKEAERLAFENHAQMLIFEQQKKFKIVDQVVHDIRSPLASMQMILPMCNRLPENLRISLNNSAERIKDIANNLLNKFKPEQIDTDKETGINNRVPTLISSDLLEIITEKKYEYGDLPIEFISKISQSGYFAFIDIDAKAFKRTLSNLINNAVDAFDGKPGEITIHLDTIDDKVQIIIEDNGKGMPVKIKEKILNNIAITSGKSNGHGIGFSQVRDALANNDGKLDIDSAIGVGTKIILTFSKITNPGWIAERIELYNDAFLIILDDDESIHGAWDARFRTFAPNLQRRHFRDGNEAISFISGLDSTEKNKIFLLTDYELLHQELCGLKVINKTGIKNSILVTSHHNNPEVRDLAKLSNTKILPKLLASEIPINIFNMPQPFGPVIIPAAVDLVFIDDDKDFVSSFKRIIENDHKILDVYFSLQEFMDNLTKYSKHTMILIDNHFKKDRMTGIEFAQQLYMLGFERLYLFSGNDYAGDSSIPWYLTPILKTDVEKVKQLLTVAS